MARRKLKKYRVGMDSETYAISLVDMPAIEEDFIYMAGQEPVKIQMMSDEKHMIYGAVLVPERPIYRASDSGEEYYLEFTKESIEKMSQDFLKDYRQHSMTLEHEEEATEVYVVESWIKTDLYKDKSVALGLNDNLPLGTWFVGAKINNVDTWNRIKSGELKGFSVESLISLEDFSAQEEKSVDFDNVSFADLQNTIRQMVHDAMNEKTEEIVMEETPAVEPVVEEPIQTPAEPQISPVEPSKPAEVVESIPEPKEEPVEQNNSVNDLTHLNELIESMKSEIEALKQMNGTLTDKVRELEAEPSAKPVVTTAGAKPQSNYESWRETMKNLLDR